MGTMSIWHWLIVLIIVMLLFGTKKIKNIGTDLGAAIKGFKEGVREGTAETPVAGNPPAANPPGVTNSTVQANTPAFRAAAGRGFSFFLPTSPGLPPP